jgi:dGTP triphosphohydrolase
MSDPNRPTSRWSTSLSVTTKCTGATNQTIPLISVRKKLFRQSVSSQKTLAQRRAKAKHDIEELFKIYYSDDVKFDTFQRQIVTGK